VWVDDHLEYFVKSAYSCLQPDQREEMEIRESWYSTF